MRQLNYIERVLVGFDQFVNTLWGGWPDETISAHSGRKRGKPGLANRLFWTPLAILLNVVERDHVEKAIKSEEDGSQQDPDYDEVYDEDDLVVKPGELK